jgi:CheY-like chemotaxis protein
MITNSKPHILIVEDEAINQIVMRCIVERAGYTCEIVDRGEIAVERVKEKSYGMIFMDVGLPGLDGGQATEFIRAYERENQLPEMPIIVISAHIQPEDHPDLYALGCTEIYIKPTSPQQIEALLRNYVPLDKSQQNVAA